MKKIYGNFKTKMRKTGYKETEVFCMIEEIRTVEMAFELNRRHEEQNA